MDGLDHETCRNDPEQAYRLGTAKRIRLQKYCILTDQHTDPLIIDAHPPAAFRGAKSWGPRLQWITLLVGEAHILLTGRVDEAWGERLSRVSALARFNDLTV